VKKRQECHVAIAPRNDITKTVFVIASKAKQSQANAGSPGIAALMSASLEKANHIALLLEILR